MEERECAICARKFHARNKASRACSAKCRELLRKSPAETEKRRWKETLRNLARKKESWTHESTVCQTCFGLPHRLKEPCPDCGLEPGPVPVSESSCVLASPCLPESDDVEQAAAGWARYKRSRRRECEWCGEEFRDYTGKDRFCSVPCAMDAEEDDLTQGAKRPVALTRNTIGDTAKCVHCGKSFILTKTAQQMCSPECVYQRKLALWKARKDGVPAEERTCAWCRKAFRSRKKNQSVCSAECRKHLKRARESKRGKEDTERRKAAAAAAA